MSLWRLACQSFWFHRRVNLAVIAAVAVATAVLTGALFVGDSLRGSLRALTLDRLGEIDFALITDRFFRAALADEVAGHADFQARYAAAVPLALMPSVTIDVPGSSARARGVTLIGCAPEFWGLQREQVAEAHAQAAGKTRTSPQGDEIWLNQELADRLGVEVGERLVLRLPQASDVPADSPLGKKEGTVRNLADLRVAAILPARGLASFQVTPSQGQSLNAFIDLSRLQAALEVPDRINAIFFATQDDSEVVDPAAPARLDAMIQPRLSDYGIRIETVQQRYQLPDEDQPRVAFEYLQLVNERLVWSDAAREAAQAVLPDGAQELFTYLANNISAGEPTTRSDSAIPYSTIAAIDSTSELGPLVDGQDNPVRLADDEIALNRWAADDLAVEIGDPISIRYFAPETTHGVATERTATFTLAHIAELTDPARPYRRRRPAEFDQPPTRATDPQLTPTVEGVTDQETIADWDPPFPFDQRRVREQDDDYWESFRTTPKAFLSLAAGQRLWGSRFGDTTAFRLPVGIVSADQLAGTLERELAERKEELGFSVVPLKANALRAARGTTSFAGLFLGFSLFLIVAALSLLSILFRLGVEQRATELGLLAALGWTRARSRWLLLLEGALVSAVGTCLGVVGGAAYAALMLGGLRTWWVDAIVSPFVQFFATPTSIVVGAASGIGTCLLVMVWCLRGLLRMAPRRLLSGSATLDTLPTRRVAGGTWWIVVLLVIAVAAAAWAAALTAEAQAGAFFGGGASLLAAGLLILRQGLRSAAVREQPGAWTLWQLAWKGLARYPGRTLMTTGLIASATFLIIAIAAFRLAPDEQGTGGFDWIAETDRPLFVDFEDPQALNRALGPAAEDLEGVRLFGLRAEPGSDASCRNLYQATRPRMFGVSPQHANGILGEAAFAWAGVSEDHRQNPWLALFEPSETIPVILDKNTALYSLHAGGHVGAEFSLDDPSGRRFNFRTVGLLSNSIFQGKLLVSESQLVQLFPENAGSRYFLVDCGTGMDCATGRQALATQFGDEGWVARPANDVLAELLAIQNTYLSTFQSLGALGLLLGTIGLACVQFRNLMERRSELGLLQALGFAPRRVKRLVFQESLLLLLAGLAIGTMAALFTTVPHMVWGAASPPWKTLLGTLGLVVACGTLSVALAVRSILKMPALQALKRE